MSPRNLINGQRPEFGNPEHIAWIREQAEKKERGVVDCDFSDWQVTYCRLAFDCPNCDTARVFAEYAEDEQEPPETAECGMCGAKYELDWIKSEATPIRHED